MNTNDKDQLLVTPMKMELDDDSDCTFTITELIDFILHNETLASKFNKYINIDNIMNHLKDLDDGAQLSTDVEVSERFDPVFNKLVQRLSIYEQVLLQTYKDEIKRQVLDSFKEDS